MGIMPLKKQVHLQKQKKMKGMMIWKAHTYVEVCAQRPCMLRDMSS
jgi:hypothetical protein